MFATLIPNAGTHFLKKGPREGVIYLQVSYMLNLFVRLRDKVNSILYLVSVVG